MHRYGTIDKYIARLIQCRVRLEEFLQLSSIEYVSEFIRNIPKYFDNSDEWRRMAWGNYNYRYGLHNSFTGLIGELMAEAFWTLNGIPCDQHFSDKEHQHTYNTDQTILANGVVLTVQCKSGFVIDNKLRVYKSVVKNNPVTSDIITFADCDRMCIVVCSTKQFYRWLSNNGGFKNEMIEIPIEVCEQTGTVTYL